MKTIEQGTSPRFEQALAFASVKHRGQTRKGSTVPYISHPMAVASLVFEYGGSEDQAIAALLHDTIEDSGVTEAELTELFGTQITQMVSECTNLNNDPDPKTKKQAYIDHLAHSSAQALLVSGCDKLHNARAISHDVRHYGAQVWARFGGGRDAVLWYYQELVKVFESRQAEMSPRFAVLVREFKRVVEEMASL